MQVLNIHLQKTPQMPLRQAKLNVKFKVVKFLNDHDSDRTRAYLCKDKALQKRCDLIVQVLPARPPTSNQMPG